MHTYTSLSTYTLKIVFGLLSRDIIRRAQKTSSTYSFLFMHPDGGQLAEIGELLTEGKIRPVIDKVFPFEQAKEALAYLATGRGNIPVGALSTYAGAQTRRTWTDY